MSLNKKPSKNVKRPDYLVLPDSLWIVIPAMDEEKRIVDVIRKTKTFTKKIVVVDDGSKDSTAKVSRKLGVVVLKHLINLGKGSALKTGCDYVVGKGAKYILVMDADGQHKPEDIPRMVRTLIENKLDIVFGGRKLNKNMPSLLKLGNWGLYQISKILFGVDVEDTQSGFRIFTSKAYKKIRWKSTDYSLESEMIARVGKNNLKYKEIPIKTIYLDRYKGTTILNGLKIGFESLLWRIKGFI